MTCSNGPDERTRKRKCEKNQCPWNPLFPCCPKIHKKHYYQVEFEPCRKLRWIFLENNFYQAFWSEWEDASDCSVSCGSGYKSQTRHCRRGNKSVGDAACEGSMGGFQSTTCNHQRCRKLKLDFVRIKGLKLIITQEKQMHFLSILVPGFIQCMQYDS